LTTFGEARFPTAAPRFSGAAARPGASSEFVETNRVSRVEGVNGSAPPTRASDALTSGARGVLEGLVIVVVDDDDDARELLATVLAQRSAKVFAADCAPRALELVERERPDILISDIAMPEEDGYSLIGRVRALSAERGGKTPSIAVTAYAGRADQKRAIDAGFDAHFAKPVDIDLLVDTLVDIRSARDVGASARR
jgi:CheY-like chemotaxis protein